jgi:type VI secretion system protein ImpL
MFPDFTLTKVYKGPTAFANFLTDFSSGAKTFKAGDFPADKTGLAKAGVTWIKVRYKIDNAQPVIAELEEGTGGRGRLHLQIANRT